MDERSLVLALHHALERAGLEDAEDADRKLLVAAERERGRVEHLQVLDDGFIEADPRVARRAAVLVRIGAVDAIDLGRLEDDLGTDLGAAQRRAVSVVKNGLPVPAAKITTLPSSRYRSAFGRT